MVLEKKEMLVLGNFVAGLLESFPFPVRSKAIKEIAAVEEEFGVQIERCCGRRNFLSFSLLRVDQCKKVCIWNEPVGTLNRSSRSVETDEIYSCVAKLFDTNNLNFLTLSDTYERPEEERSTTNLRKNARSLSRRTSSSNQSQDPEENM